jgi:hypothetical protein
VQHALGLALAEAVRVGEGEQQRLAVEVEQAALLALHEVARDAELLGLEVQVVELAPGPVATGVYDLYAAMRRGGAQLGGALQQRPELPLRREHLAARVLHGDPVAERELGQELAGESQGRARARSQGQGRRGIHAFERGEQLRDRGAVGLEDLGAGGGVERGAVDPDQVAAQRPARLERDVERQRVDPALDVARADLEGGRGERVRWELWWPLGAFSGYNSVLSNPHPATG